jgi:DNA-binding HxlR family transcriptional regulator
MTLLQGVLADRDAWTAVGQCSIEKTMSALGTKSAMLIMREAYYGTTRFDDFAHRVGVTKAAAAARLAELVDLGLLTRQPYREPGQRTRDEYVLTEAGIARPQPVTAHPCRLRRRRDRRGPLRRRPSGTTGRTRRRIDQTEPRPRLLTPLQASSDSGWLSYATVIFTVRSCGRTPICSTKLERSCGRSTSRRRRQR